MHQHREADAARIEPDEVRREHDHRTLRRGFLEMMQVDPADVALDAFAATPPDQAAIEQRLRERAKVRARQLATLDLVHLREARAQVDARDTAALRGDGVEQHAERGAERARHRHRKKAERAQDAEPEAGHGCGVIDATS